MINPNDPLQAYFNREEQLAVPYKDRWRTLLIANRDKIWRLNSTLTDDVLASTHPALLTDLYPYEPTLYIDSLHASITAGLTGSRHKKLAYTAVLETFAEASSKTLSVLNNEELWWGRAGGMAITSRHASPIVLTKLPWQLFPAERNRQLRYINNGLELACRYLLLSDTLAQQIGGLASHLSIVDYYEPRFAAWFDAYAQVMNGTNRN